MTIDAKKTIKKPASLSPWCKSICGGTGWVWSPLPGGTALLPREKD